jgi:hypothetical protein
MSRAGFGEGQSDIETILSALEFGARKEEANLLDSVFAELGVARQRTQQAMAAAIEQGPGFEPFLVAVLRTVRPFAIMLREVYEFLNRQAATATRRASVFRVRSETARQALDFSLDNFPKELVASLVEERVTTYRVALQFPDLNEADSPLVWSSAAAEAWRAISPMWDNDFYDDGFHRALSYAATVLPEGDQLVWGRLHDLVDMLLDRLAAIVTCVNSVRPVEISETDYYARAGDPLTLRPEMPQTRGHEVLCAEARRTLTLPTKLDDAGKGTDPIAQKIEWHIASMVVALHLFRNQPIARIDRDDWLKDRLTAPTVDSYLDLVARFADDYTTRLDAVAPVVDVVGATVVKERLLEFLLLPFWKQRWFLYELWTLVLVLKTADGHWKIELEGVKETSPGVLEWKLPGGSATVPVASIGYEQQRALCWTQRKTYHPLTGEGLEPDLRITGTPETHDLFVVENKDRLKPAKAEMREVLRRYVEGTCAASVWLVNYEAFTPGVEQLSQGWSQRHVHAVSGFRPGEVPRAFTDELVEVLGGYLGPATTGGVPLLENADGEESGVVRIDLSWGAAPRDLDLHVWMWRSDGARHVWYGDPGGGDASSSVAGFSGDALSGNGAESITVATDGLSALAVAVHNYSGEHALAGSGARVTITLPGGVAARLIAPDQPTGSWWSVARYEHSTRALSVIGTLGDKPPH